MIPCPAEIEGEFGERGGKLGGVHIGQTVADLISIFGYRRWWGCFDSESESRTKPRRDLAYSEKKEFELMASLDWSQCPAVESIPGKVSGAWVLRGTRTPVKVVFENLEAGMNIEEVIEQFPVTREQMDSLMAFVARSLEKEPSYA